MSEVLGRLLGQDLVGTRLTIQLHGEPLPDAVDALAGARVLTVPVYRWAPSTEPTWLQRMVEAIAGRQVDAVTFTSAPAV